MKAIRIENVEMWKSTTLVGHKLGCWKCNEPVKKIQIFYNLFWYFGSLREDECTWEGGGFVVAWEMYLIHCVGEIETYVIRSKLLGKPCSGRENEETFGRELRTIHSITITVHT